jgi:hypothetical protein
MTSEHVQTNRVVKLRRPENVLQFRAAIAFMERSLRNTSRGMSFE